jgi:hypothetical protein
MLSSLGLPQRCPRPCHHRRSTTSSTHSSSPLPPCRYLGPSTHPCRCSTTRSMTTTSSSRSLGLIASRARYDYVFGEARATRRCTTMCSTWCDLFGSILYALGIIFSFKVHVCGTYLVQELDLSTFIRIWI